MGGDPGVIARAETTSDNLPSSPLLNLLARHPRAAILSCFFLSGATGLIYEVVWSRQLTLIFGATVLAVSTVLAAFFGGLAVGSVVFGRIADRCTHRLRLYALLETAIGLCCLATPYVFALVQHAYIGIYPLFEGNLVALRLVLFVMCAGVLIVPTAFMGGTLPVLSRALTSRLDEMGTSVARLYAINTLGAVVGATAAGFILIPAIGLKGAVTLAAVVNLAVAAVAFALHWLGADQGGAAPTPAEEHVSMPEAARGGYRALLVAYAFSGAAALIYEICWTRILSLAFGTSTYAFSAMLAAFLAGIGLGSLVPATWRRCSVDRIREPLIWFGVLQIAIGASVTLITPILDNLPFVFLALFKKVGPQFWGLQFAELGISLLVMLLPAGLMGFAFPLVTRLATESLGVLGRRLAAVYAANTFGTVVGSFAAGFLLIPALGVRSALGVGVALNVLIGLAYLASGWKRRPSVAAAGVGLAALAGLAWVLLPGWNQAVLCSGAYIYPSFYLSGDAKQMMQEKQVLYYRDGLTATISVTKVNNPLSGEELLSLQINGKSDASTGDLSTQLMLAHLPALLHPDPASVLVIGLASGCTVGGLLQHEKVRSIDCIEIEPEMKRVTEFFRDINRDCLKDPRVNLTLDDARHYAMVSRKKYDLITSEPSNPWIAGVANLFTLEHFRNCRERLAPGGLFCQWLPLYNLSPNDLRSAVATFGKVFPHVSMWVFPDLITDAYLIGTLEPQAFDVADIASRASAPSIRQDLKGARLRDPWDLLSGYLFGADVLQQISVGATLNTDDSPVLEFSSPMHLYSEIARKTTWETLSLATHSGVPLGRCGTPRAGRYESAVVGVTLSAPWSAPPQEGFSVGRDAGKLLGPDRLAGLSAVAHLKARLGVGEGELYACRFGTGRAGLPPTPSAPPHQVLVVSGHEAQVWLPPHCEEGVAWVASWDCLKAGRSYLATARPDSKGRAAGVLEALQGCACCD